MLQQFGADLAATPMVNDAVAAFDSIGLPAIELPAIDLSTAVSNAVAALDSIDLPATVATLVEGAAGLRAANASQLMDAPLIAASSEAFRAAVDDTASLVVEALDEGMMVQAMDGSMQLRAPFDSDAFVGAACGAVESMKGAVAGNALLQELVPVWMLNMAGPLCAASAEGTLGSLTFGDMMVAAMGFPSGGSGGPFMSWVQEAIQGWMAGVPSVTTFSNNVGARKLLL